jgi:hypothetical protein
MATEWHSEQFVFCSCQLYSQSGIRNLVWAEFSKQCATKFTSADHSHASAPSGSSRRHSITAVIIQPYLAECLWCSFWTFSTEMIWNLVFRSNYTSDSWNPRCVHAGWPWLGITSSFWMKPRVAQAVSCYHETFPPRWGLICIILIAINLWRNP